MSMVVQHNMQAANANRMLGITSGAQAKSTEKLSSGYKINRAADDAAGLTISEKMRKQIRGLDKASSNAQDGVSSVQTAEGALTEVHSMLQRMNELAVQASNGTNSSDDRSAIQDEVNQLTTEIDRVAETTKFNEIYLLKGDSNGNTKNVYMNAHDAGLKGSLTDGATTATFKIGAGALDAGKSITIGGKDYTIGATVADGKALLGTTYDGSVKAKVNGTEYTLVVLGLNTALRISDLLNLRWRSVYDFKKNCFRDHLLIWEHKTGKRNYIAINQNAKNALYLYFMEKNPDPEEYVFSKRTNPYKPLSRSQAYRIIKEDASHTTSEEAISCHSLRKTFGYYAWQEGVQPALLMNVFNHSSFHITKRYLGIEQDEKDLVYLNINL